VTQGRIDRAGGVLDAVGRSTPARLAAAAVAVVVVVLVLRVNLPRPEPGPTAEQRRVLVAAARIADPGLAGLTDDQLVRLARELCARLDAGADPSHPVLDRAAADATRSYTLSGASYTAATRLAVAVYCPRYTAAVERR
jgi:hypothetical protein